MNYMYMKHFLWICKIKKTWKVNIEYVLYSAPHHQISIDDLNFELIKNINFESFILSDKDFRMGTKMVQNKIKKLRDYMDKSKKEYDDAEINIKKMMCGFY